MMTTALVRRLSFIIGLLICGPMLVHATESERPIKNLPTPWSGVCYVANALLECRGASARYPAADGTRM